MATLSQADLKEVWGQVMRQEDITAKLSSAITGLLKADIRAAVDGIDQWISDNSVSFNSAIPQPARGVLTSSQKTAIFCYIATKRFKSGV